MLRPSQMSQTLNPSSFIMVFHLEITNLHSFLFGCYFHLEVTNLPFVSYYFIQKTETLSCSFFIQKSQTLDCSILWLFSSQKPQTLGPSFGAIVFIQNQTLGPFFFELFSSNSHKLDVQTFFYCCFHLKTHKPKVVPFVVILFIQKS